MNSQPTMVIYNYNRELFAVSLINIPFLFYIPYPCSHYILFHLFDDHGSRSFPYSFVECIHVQSRFGLCE